MLVTVFRRIEKINGRSIIRIVLLLVVFLIAGTGQAATRGAWEQWLDSAWQLTWHDREDISRWIAEKETTVFDQPLAAFVAGQEARMTSAATDQTVKQLAIAQLLVYLQTSDPLYVMKARKTISAGALASRREMPEVAFWYHYILAHDNLEKGDARAFTRNVFAIFLDVVLKLETDQMKLGGRLTGAPLQGFYRSTPYLYRNLANLILQRAIVRRQMEGVDALGVVIWNLSARMPAKGYGKWVREVSRHMGGPESDDFRLGFAVRLIEADQNQAAMENALDAGGESDQIKRLVRNSLDHYRLLHRIARTRHGVLTAATQQLGFGSSLLSRMFFIKPQQKSARELSILNLRQGDFWPAFDTALDRAISVFAELAGIQQDLKALRKAGFSSTEDYIASMHALWQGIMDACLDAATYQEQRILPGKRESLTVRLPFIENKLRRYLDFFEQQVCENDPPEVPDNAFYGAAEAAELLSDIYFLSAQWERGLKKYDLSLGRRVQAMELFPLDVNNYYTTTRMLTGLGRLEKYNLYVATQSNRLMVSPVVGKVAFPDNSSLARLLQQLKTAVPEVIARAPYSIVLHQGFSRVPKELGERLAHIETQLADQSSSDQADAADRVRVRQLVRRLRKELKQPYAGRNKLFQVLGRMDRLIDQLEKTAQSETAEKDDAQSPLRIDLFPGGLRQSIQELRQIQEECTLLKQLPDIGKLREELVQDPLHPFHKLLRQLYDEKSADTFNYRTLLGGSGCGGIIGK